MKTTKTVAGLVLIFALIVGGCSSTATTTQDGTSTSPLSTMSTTLGAGDTTGTPQANGTLDNTTTTPMAGGTSDTTTTPKTGGTTDTTTTPMAGSTLDTTTTPMAGGTTDTTTTPMAGSTLDTTTTPMAGGTDTTSTPGAAGTVDPKGTPTVSATMDSKGTTTPMATMMTTTKTPEAMGTPSPTVAADANATPAPTTEALTPGTGSVTAPGDLSALEASFEKIYNQVNPSVVYIEVVMGSAASNSSGSGPQRASGSGFVWDAQGHIVTNNHVVNGATTVSVTFMDGTMATAKVVGQDPNADLAVLMVTAPAAELHPVTMGDSTKVRVGQIAIAIGNPFGLAGSMSQGIISALARSLPVEASNPNSAAPSTGATTPTTGVYNIPNIIQTDAAINPGNSGGVLVNLQGQVIGVTAAIASQSQANSGIGFVIPSEIVSKVVPVLITSGKYAHPWLGVSGLSMSPDVASQGNLPATQRGALIIAVTPGGPAATAGLMPSTIDSTTGNMTTVGDIVTAINGKPVTAFEDLGSYLFLNTKPGDVVTLTVLRGGKEQTVKVTMGTLPTP